MIHKIAGIIIKDKKFLCVKERGLDVLITPGGKQEMNENAEETLRREIKEELGLDLVSMKFFGDFTDKVYQTNDDLNLEAYFADVDGVPEPSSEIEKFFWVDSKFDDKEMGLSRSIQKYIIPKLLKMKLIE